MPRPGRPILLSPRRPLRPARCCPEGGRSATGAPRDPPPAPARRCRPSTPPGAWSGRRSRSMALRTPKTITGITGITGIIATRRSAGRRNATIARFLAMGAGAAATRQSAAQCAEIGQGNFEALAAPGDPSVVGEHQREGELVHARLGEQLLGPGGVVRVVGGGPCGGPGAWPPVRGGPQLLTGCARGAVGDRLPPPLGRTAAAASRIRPPAPGTSGTPPRRRAGRRGRPGRSSRTRCRTRGRGSRCRPRPSARRRPRSRRAASR